MVLQDPYLHFFGTKDNSAFRWIHRIVQGSDKVGEPLSSGQQESMRTLLYVYHQGFF